MQKLLFSLKFLRISMSTIKLSPVHKMLIIFIAGSIFTTSIALIVGSNKNLKNSFLEDMDFLIYHLEESFPFFGVIERRLDMDLREALLGLRRDIQNHNMMVSKTQFYRLLAEEIERFGYVAHLWVFHPDTHVKPGNFNAGHSLPPPSGQPASFDSTSQGIFTANILEEEKIAHLIISDTNLFTSDELRYLLNTLEKVQDYEHLIIDIRPTRGGYCHDLLHHLITPNIPQGSEIYYNSFAFFTEGELAGRVADFQRKTGSLYYIPSYGGLRQDSFITYYGGGSAHHDIAVESEILPANEMVKKYNLYNIKEDDLANLTYGYKLITIIRGVRVDNIPFNGKIWVLTAPNNYSAAEGFAELSKAAGFTLVGQTTGGAIGGGGTAYFRLPNTNINVSLDTLYITDDTGRAKEEFPTEPHYHISPDEDALDVTLELIRQGR